MCAYHEYGRYQDQSAHKLLTDTPERYWWQSRHNMRDPPDLADLSALARKIRTPA